ncbi:MAG: Inner membrane protein YbaL [Candidatus Ordinivivax streblomastigis]|uniref:Inner membrane protein YbaL n=1 Tax=Candidatus Ordinivivax streblomastigis TaxID=2540710 RepID=A0A5M8NZZ4_9BACT|nr:MAG: Inner membrane protein YbaL [Candidatus Ordinivivax streblomastigis]
MSELSPLIIDLALILVVASGFSLLFKWLKQPVVLAYIVAGIVISFIIPQHSEGSENIETWAEIGIIFLLFGLGLEFSFKKLMKVGPTAFISTIFVVFSMIGLGYLTGLCFGWGHQTSLFLGAMLCMSSTMIIIKVFDDLNLTKKSFAGIVLGMLIIEDLVAVLLMVLLSTIGVSQHFQGTEMLFSLFKLVAFLLFWFLLGTFLIPSILRTMKRFLNDETLLLFALALCLGMVYLATLAGFSSALGAFIMGSILAETLDAERIDKMIMPIKNFFGAIFFVSVGMMINVASLGAYIVPILIISLVVIIGQMLFATTGILLAGQNLKTATAAGFSLTQIGEFSYIIAGLGLSLGVIEPSLYQIIVSASVLTIFATPYMMKLSGPAYQYLERVLPESWQNFLNKNASGAHPVNQNSIWYAFLRKVAVNALIYYLLCIIIVFFTLNYGVPTVQEFMPGWKGNLVSAIVILLLISPFLRNIIVKQEHSTEFLRLWRVNKGYRGPLVFTIVIRILMCCGLIMYVLFNLFHTNFVIALTLALIILILFMTSRRLRHQTIKLERRFKENLNEKEQFEESQKPLTQGFTNHLLERDLHLSDFLIQPQFSIVGKTLKELQFRQAFGVNIVTIVRGDTRINIPNGDERVYPNDHLIVLGTDTQIELFQQQIEVKKQKYAEHQEKPAHEVVLRQLEIESDSPLIGKNIQTSRIQSDYDCMIVGVERNHYSILNPKADLNFAESDIVWIVGESKNIKQLKNLCNCNVTQ